MATALPLEGDGLIDNLFHFLWSKDDFGSGPRIYVPHTVLFKAAQPSAWYFTSLKTGKIKKKNKVNLTNLQIEHEFTKHSRQLHGSSSSGENTDIVACYLYQLPGSYSDDHDEPAASTIIEYFDATALHEFLFSREKPHNGMLQRFILPKGTHNATIRAIWSPKICLLERRVNNKSLYDPRFSVYERGVTFDGGGAGELFTKPEPVRGAMLPGEVQLLCEQIVDHVTQVSYHKYRISRMVLHLKADADDRLWLLWCSSLRLLHVGANGGSGGSGDTSSMRPLDIVSEAHVPSHISLGRVSHAALSPSSSPKPHHHANSNSKSGSKHHRHSNDEDDPDTPLRDGFQRCTSCARVVEQFRMLSTTYKAVLQHFQKFLLFLRLKVNEQEQVAIAWPPDQQLIQAAGGVGFGILRFCERSSSPSKPQHANTMAGKPHLAGLNAQELIIPPVIQYLHPTLGVDDFERHRHDPIFLHKPVAVCESCCLVYSDFATSALEINSLRPSVPAILRPQREVNDLKRRLDPIDPISMAVTSPGRKTGSTGSKPPASAWKPIPRNVEKAAKLMRSGGFGLSRSTLHLLPPAPTLPDRIESLAAFIGNLPPSITTNSPSSLTDQQREETFFRELYHQQGADAGEGHPLHHMLESSGQLAQLSSVKNKQLRAIRKGVADATLGAGSGSGFGSQSSSSLVDWQSAGLGKSASMSALDRVLNKKPTRNPYTVVQKLTTPHDQQSASSLKHQRRQQTKKHRQRRAAPSWEEQGEDDEEEDRENGEISGSKSSLSPSNKHNNNTSNNSKSSPPRRRYVSSREAQASNAHQEFLFAALSDAQQQLEHLESLASIVLGDDPQATASSSSSLSSSSASSHANQASSPPGVLLDAVAPADTIDELQSLMSENASLYDDEDDEDNEIHNA